MSSRLLENTRFARLRRGEYPRTDSCGEGTAGVTSPKSIVEGASLGQTSPMRQGHLLLEDTKSGEELADLRRVGAAGLRPKSKCQQPWTM